MDDLRENFLQMLEKYQSILHKVSLIYFRHEDERKDNFQEIVYQMWKAYASLRNRETVVSWIYSISINTSISRIRKDSRMQYREELPDEACVDMAKQWAVDEDMGMLLTAIYDLNDIDKSIILLYLEEKSYEEISEIIGISKSNVRTRINRAKNVLKHNLIKMGYEKG